MLSMRAAGPDDAALIHGFVVALAEYEREPAAVEVTPDMLREQLASQAPPFECVIAEVDGSPAGFALFFHTYSTWRGKRGLWLEDLFVLPSRRRHGVGKALLAHLAASGRFSTGIGWRSSFTSALERTPRMSGPLTESATRRFCVSPMVPESRELQW